MEIPLLHGKLHIVDQVIAVIAESVVLNTDGVDGLVSSLKDGVFHAVTKKSGRGVLVSSEAGHVTIEVKVSVNFGVHIGKTCASIQKT